MGEVVSDCSSNGVKELHVLAVDDSLVDRKVIEKLLKISCCKVTAVESGRRALQYLGLDGENSSVAFHDLKVNLIMTDYSMPGMTGYDLLKKIKGSPALREVPVVIMSSENILARIDRCMEEGAEEFLVKPVQLADVKRLKDFILGGDGEESQERGSCKRKDLSGSLLPSTSSPSPSVVYYPSSSPRPTSAPMQQLPSFAYGPPSSPRPISAPMQQLPSFAYDPPSSPRPISAPMQQSLSKRPRIA